MRNAPRIAYFFAISAIHLFLCCHALQATPLPDTVSRYDMSVKVIPDRQRMEVSGIVVLPVQSAEQSEIKLLLFSKMKNVSMEILEPKSAGSQSELIDDRADGDRTWTIKLSNPIPKNTVIRIRFSYAFEGEPSPQLNISGLGSFAGGSGELWYPQIAYKNREVGTLRFTVPEGDTAIANGESKSSDHQNARGEYVFEVRKPVKFAFAAGKYQIYRRKGKVPFTLYQLKSRADSRKLADACANTLNFLSGLFGEFPFEEMSLVEVDFRSRVTGTSEFGFILADDSEFDRYNLAYWAHEIGHQWWGNVVRSKSGEPGQMLFSEGLAQFGALQAVEAIEGPTAAEEFRRFGYRGIRRSQSAEGYFESVRAGKDRSLTQYKPLNQDDVLLMHRLANSKGFILLDMLSREIGRSRFSEILKTFIRKYSNQQSSWSELETTILSEGKGDVRSFFDQWFDRQGAPDYRSSWKQIGGSLRVVIEQPEPYFRSRIEVEIRFHGSRRIVKTVEVRGGKSEFVLPMSNRVISVTLDPHYKVLRWMPEFRTNSNKFANKIDRNV